MPRTAVRKEPKKKKAPLVKNKTFSPENTSVRQISKIDLIFYKIKQLRKLCHNNHYVPNEESLCRLIDLTREILLMQDDFEANAKKINSRKFFKIRTHSCKVSDFSNEINIIKNEVPRNLAQKKRLFEEVKQLLEAALSHKVAYSLAVGSKLLTLFSEG